MLMSRTLRRLLAATATFAFAAGLASVPVTLRVDGASLSLEQASAFARKGADNGASHDKGDDKGGLKGGRKGGKGGDDGASHDKGDDKGGRSRGGDSGTGSRR